MDEDSFVDRHFATPERAPEYVGMSEVDASRMAQARGVAGIRVVSVDGWFGFVRGREANRLSVTIEQGYTTQAWWG